MSFAIQPAIARVGGFFALAGDAVRGLAKRPFPVQEFLEQTVFIASVSVVPVIFVTIPFTVVVQFFLGQLLTEIGAVDLSGAGAGLAVIQELGPICSVLVVAGAGATAVCADLGSRKIREELDAMEALGIDPVDRLVAPRILAFTVVSVGLYGIVASVGLIGTFVFSTVILNASPGLFVANLTLLSGFSAFVIGVIKTAVFGFAAALVACYLGLNAKGGPKGVGEAVNQTVVFTLMALMVLNTLITTIFIQIGK
ncbi:MAG: transporter permease [Aeromicrobium sp.]|nr:transporter permease [Aeromicrobium sp.]